MGGYRSARGGEGEAEPRPSVRNALELLGLVIAPTTLLTALAFYFGWTLTNVRANYFGIDPSTLGFSTTDYVLRSADALFVPLVAVVLVALAAVVVRAAVRSGLSDPRLEPWLRRSAWMVGALGAVLLAIGITAIFRPLPVGVHYLLPPLAPGVGVVLLACAVRLRGVRLSSLTVALVAVLAVLSGFWTASEYAEALGLGRAQQLERSLSSRPSVVVYAQTRLHLDARGVEETRLEAPESGYAFRYAGLRLLVRSGGNYFLLPDDWSRERGVVIVLPERDDLRVEFRPGR